MYGSEVQRRGRHPHRKDGSSQDSGEIAQGHMKRQKQEQRLHRVRLVQPSHTPRPEAVPSSHQHSGSSWGSAFLRKKKKRGQTSGPKV